MPNLDFHTSADKHATSKQYGFSIATILVYKAVFICAFI